MFFSHFIPLFLPAEKLFSFLLFLLSLPHGDIYDNEKQAPGMLLQRNDSADVPKLRIFPISIIYSIYLAITILIRYHLNI